MPTISREIVRWYCKLRWILCTWALVIHESISTWRWLCLHPTKLLKWENVKKHLKMRLSRANTKHFGRFFGNIFLPSSLFTWFSFVRFIFDFSQFLLCRLTSNHLRSSTKNYTDCFRHDSNAIRFNSVQTKTRVNVRSFIALDGINNKGTPT